MIEIQNAIMPSLTAFSLVLAIWQVADRYYWRARKRRQQLEAAKMALIQHYDALRKILDDPAPTPAIKDMIVWFSDGISNRIVAEHLVTSFCDAAKSHKLNKATADDSKLIKDIDTLRISRPDLADAIAQAVATGFMAMVLRWDKTATMFESTMSMVVSNPRQEIIAAAKTAREQKKMTNGHNGPHAVAV
jgi:hypothetical protein